MLRSQLICISQQSAQAGLALLLIGLTYLGHGCAQKNGSQSAKCCAGLLCNPDINASQVPKITIHSGLRPNAPHLQTLAREQTQRALASVRDLRLSRVQLARDCNPSLLEQEGPGLSDVWYASTGTTDVELLWSVRYLNDALAQPPSVVSDTAVPTDAAMLQAADSTENNSSNPAWNARLCGALEYAAEPLLRAHASGNLSWLQRLDADAAAGKPLPAELLVPRPGEPGGPAAVPLLLLYRRDWWRALLAAAASGGGNGSGGRALSEAQEEATLPPTWPLLVQLVSGLLNWDLDGDGQQDHVLCVDLMPGCKGWALLSAIFASLVQTNGTQQGVWFNLTDLTPALGGPALSTALRLYGDLAASNAAPFTPGGTNGSRSSVPVTPSELLAGGGAVDEASGAPLCGAVNPLFAAGRCLFTIDWGAAALRLTKEAAPGVAGWLGAALLPGSASVAMAPPSRSSPPSSFPAPQAGPPPAPALSLSPFLGLTMEQCTAATCPYADTVPAESLTALAAVLRTTAAGAAAGLVASAAVQSVRVNRAPLVGDAANVWMLASGQTVESFIQTDDFLRLVGFQLGMKYMALLRPLQQQQQQHAAVKSAVNADGGPTIALPAKGFVYPGMALDIEPSDRQEVLQAINASVSHPNSAMDILLPYSSLYRSIMDDLATTAAQLLLATSDSAAGGNDPLSLPSSQLQTLITKSAAKVANVTEAFPYSSILMHLYLHSISAPLPRREELAPESDGGGGGVDRSPTWRLAVPVVASVICFLIMSVVTVCLVAVLRRRWRARRWLPPSCRTKPPGAGQPTTLALTDVQSSTMLWEVLSAELMDACMSIHHGIMRKAIESYSGYEVFTEGDAFAVAFHGPGDALGFALDVQVAMLKADWPQELLDHPEASEVWSRRNSHLQWTNIVSGAGAAANAVAAGTSGIGSPRRMTAAGLVAAGSSGVGSNTGGGGGSGLENSLTGLARLAKGSKRLRALLAGSSSRGGINSTAGGLVGQASSLTSGESFRASASAAMLRLLPPATATAAAAQHSSQAQRPFSSFLPRIEPLAMPCVPIGSPSSVAAAATAAAAIAAAEVESAAAFAQHGSMEQAPWSIGDPRPLLAMMNFEWFRNASTNGISKIEWPVFRPGDNAASALQMNRAFGRQSVEGAAPREPHVAGGSTRAPFFGNPWAAGLAIAGQAEPQTLDVCGQGYGYGTRNGTAAVGQLPQPPQMGWWHPKLRAPSYMHAAERQPRTVAAVGLKPAVLRVGGEVLEQSVSLSPPQLLQHQLRVPASYLAASRSAGSTACASGVSSGRNMLPSRPSQLPVRFQDGMAAADTATAAAAAAAVPGASRLRLGRRCPQKCASMGSSALVKPYRELPSLPSTFSIYSPKASRLQAEASSPLLPLPQAEPNSGSAVASAVTRSARATAAAPQISAGCGLRNVEMVTSAPICSAAAMAQPPAFQSPPLLRPAQAEDSTHPVTASSSEALVLRRQYSGVTIQPPALPSHAAPATPQFPSGLIPPQQQAHNQRGAVRIASRLSLVSMDRSSDTISMQRGGSGSLGRRGRLLSFFNPSSKNSASVAAATSAAHVGPMQPEHSAATIGLHRQASFTATSSPARLGTGALPLPVGRSLSFTARQRPDPERLWPPTSTNRWSPLHTILSSSSGRSNNLPAIQSSEPAQLGAVHVQSIVPSSQHQEQRTPWPPLPTLLERGHPDSAQLQSEQARRQERRQLQQTRQVQDRRIVCVSEPFLPAASASALTRTPSSPPQPENHEQHQHHQSLTLATVTERPPPGDVCPHPPSSTSAASASAPFASRVKQSSNSSPLHSDTHQDLSLNPLPDPELGPEPPIPDRILGRDWSLNPWLDLQVVRASGDVYSTRELFDGVPRLAEGHEGDEGTASGTRAFDSQVLSVNLRRITSRDDWQWQQPGSPTDVSASASKPPAMLLRPLLVAATTAAALAGPRLDASRNLFRTSSSTASSRRRSTGCTFESSGSAGDLLRALHQEAASAKVACRLSTSVVTLGPSVGTLPVARVLQAVISRRTGEPANAAAASSTAKTTAPPPPPPPRVEGLGDSVRMDSHRYPAVPPVSDNAGPLKTEGRSGGGSGGGGGSDNDCRSGKLVAVDAELLFEAERVLNGSGRGGDSAIRRNNETSGPTIRRCCSEAVATGAAKTSEGNTAAIAAASGRRYGSAATAATAAASTTAVNPQLDLSTALSHFDDGGAGQLLEWRSVVTWEVDVEETSDTLIVDLEEACPEQMRCGGNSQQLPPLSGGPDGGREADGSPHNGGGGALANRSAFFRTWRNVGGGGGTQLPSDHPVLQAPQVTRRHACNSTSVIANGGSAAIGTGGGGGAGGCMMGTHSTLHAGEVATDAASQEDLRRTSTNNGSGRLINRLSQAVRKVALRGGLTERDRDQDRERELSEVTVQQHPPSEGAAASTTAGGSGGLSARPLGHFASSSWIRRPSRRRFAEMIRAASSVAEGGGDGSNAVGSAVAHGGVRDALMHRGHSSGSGASSITRDSSGTSKIETSAPIATGELDSGEGGSAKGAGGSSHGGAVEEVGNGGNGLEVCGEEVIASGGSMIIGVVSTQSNTVWESTAAADQLAAAAAAATAAGVALPSLSFMGLLSTALASLTNDSDDARQYYMRPEYMLANGSARLRSNIVASASVAASAAATPSPPAQRTVAEDSVFDLLWRDLNAAASTPCFNGATTLPPPLLERHGHGTNWPQAAAATVASALRLLYDHLTHAEAVLSYIMEGGSGVHREGVGGGGAPELVLRGLRIRIGLHSGPREEEVELSVVDRVLVGRYMGDFLATCKEVSEASVGGMVVLSGAAFRTYHQLRTRIRQQHQQEAVMLLHVGDHIVRSASQADQDCTRASTALAAASELAALPRELYAAVSPGLLPRLAMLQSPVRTAREVVPGCLSAPAGVVAPVFCNVVGVEALLAWEKVLMARMLRKASTNIGVSGPNQGQSHQHHNHGYHHHHQHHQHQLNPLLKQQSGGGVSMDGDASGGLVRTALNILRIAVSEVAAMHDGYVVASSSDGGHWVLVFGSAENAVLWSLGMLEAMLGAAWPEELLDHELTEEVWEGTTLLKRGLRLRIGIDYGRAMVRLVPRTGRLDYVGKPLNRAARIAAKAKAATVLVSDAVWASCRASLEAVVTPTSLGLVQLKGVREPLELWAIKGRMTNNGIVKAPAAAAAVLATLGATRGDE